MFNWWFNLRSRYSNPSISSNDFEKFVSFLDQFLINSSIVQFLQAMWLTNYVSNLIVSTSNIYVTIKVYLLIDYLPYLKHVTMEIHIEIIGVDSHLNEEKAPF